MELKTKVAKQLLDIKAVQIQPNNYFTWTSGLKSPIYCDNRLTMSYPEVRNTIVQAFAQKIKEQSEQPDVIAGCATAGIPHAAWLAEKLNLPMAYVRSSAKGHGKGNQIEGEIKAGQKVVVIEDLISTGGSVLTAVKAIVEAGAEVVGVYAIFTYGLAKAKEQFAAAKVGFDTITNYDELLHLLESEGKISSDEKAELENWRNTL